MPKGLQERRRQLKCYSLKTSRCTKQQREFLDEYWTLSGWRQQSVLHLLTIFPLIPAWVLSFLVTTFWNALPPFTIHNNKCNMLALGFYYWLAIIVKWPLVLNMALFFSKCHKRSGCLSHLKTEKDLAFANTMPGFNYALGSSGSS